MEPLPQSLQVLHRLERSSGEQLLGPLTDVSHVLAAMVPSCLGFSLSYVQQGIAVTFLATGTAVAVLDGGPDAAVLDDGRDAAGGPSADGTDAPLPLDHLTDPLDEQLWAVLGQAGAAYGVRSTLSLPLHDGSTVVGGVNLYAAAPAAFAHVVDEIATIFGAWAGDAVHNADLGWCARADSEEGVQRLEDAGAVEQAIGVLCAGEDVDVAAARARIDQAALRAGIRPVEVARAIMAMHDVPEER